MRKRRLWAALLALLLLALPLLSGCTDGGELDTDLLRQAGDVLGALLEEDGETAADPEDAAGPEDAAPGMPDAATGAAEGEPDGDEAQAPASGERYSDPERVAAYLHAYGELPPNFIRKDEAKALGWDSARGNLWDVTDGMSIGGDRFGNREGLLPEADGRVWYECDVNYAGGFRGAERIVYSNDGLIYYTADHYESITLLYGEGD